MIVEQAMTRYALRSIANIRDKTGSASQQQIFETVKSEASVVVVEWRRILSLDSRRVVGMGWNGQVWGQKV